MKLSALTHLERNARRLTEILAVLGKYGLADWLGGLNYEWLQGRLVSFDGERLGRLSREARVRLALTDLGTTFIKLGQMLSTRGDIIGPELANELGQLRSNTPPDPAKKIRETIETELGQPVDALFPEFHETALASASIGQVHKARLVSGEAVVVKVQHSGIEDTIASDLDIMAGLAEVLQKHVKELRNYQPSALVRDFRRLILQELDFSTERRNLEEFARNFRKSAAVHFPVVYPELSSRRVLVMELLEGISLENLYGLKESQINLPTVALQGANMYLEMIFRDGFYHADPHPGNLMVLRRAGGSPAPAGQTGGTKDGRANPSKDGQAGRLPYETVVGVLDCGMVGRIDDQMREDIENILLGIVQKDAQEVTEIVTRLGSVPPDLDRDALRGEISNYVADYAHRPLRDFNLSEALNRLTDIIRRYRVLLPPACALLLKTLVMLEGTAQQLNPQFSLAELIRPFQSRSLKRRFSWRRRLQRMYQTYRDWDRLLESLPRDFSDILRRVRTGRFEVHHVHRRLETNVNRMVLGILTAALFVGSALLWSTGAQPAPGGVSIPGVAGYLVAIVMGFQLIWRISRSDDDGEHR